MEEKHRVERSGIPHSRTRGARRRLEPPTASSKPISHTVFPSLRVRIGRQWGHSDPEAAQQQQQEEEQRKLYHNQPQCSDEENDARERADALRSRLHAAGLKRSIVEAQLFPDVAVHGAGTNYHPLNQDIRNTVSSNWAEIRMGGGPSQDDKLIGSPLVPALALHHPTGAQLIPSRPTTSTASSQQRHQFPAPPNTAREISSTPMRSNQLMNKVPMTARDQYYVDRRVTTAPSLSPSMAGKRTRSGRSASGGAQERPSRSEVTQQMNNTKESQEGDVPKRSELLTRNSQFKPLTQTIAEFLSNHGDSSMQNQSAQPGITVARDSFLYLRRVDSNPYNLVVTNHAHINPNNYYTVSRLGITHFAYNSSEFLSMEKFEREHYLYSLIVKLPFFKKYRLWKRFTLWRQALNARKRAHAALSLSQNLFFLLPHLHQALIQLRGACLELFHIHLFNFEHTGLVSSSSEVKRAGPERTSHSKISQQKTYTLTEFSIRLKSQKVECERLIDQFIAQAEMVAKDACEKFLYSFLQGTGFNQAPKSSRPTDKKKGYASTKNEYTSEMESEVDPEKKMTYTERATMRTQCCRISKFLRVVEFFLSDALLQVAILSTERLHCELFKIMNSQTRTVAVETISAAKNIRSQLGSRVLYPPLFRVEMMLRTSFPSIGTIAASGNNIQSVKSQRRFVRNSGFLATTSCDNTKQIVGMPCTVEASTPRNAPSSIDRLIFTPTSEVLRSQVETLVFNGLKAVTHRDRLLCNSMFKVYVEATLDDGVRGGNDDDDGGENNGTGSGDGMDLDILIMEDATFVETLQGINTIILDAYAHAAESCRTFSSFLEMYDANLLFCKQVSEPSYFLNRDIDEFRHFLDKYTEQIRVFEALPDVSPCGLLLLDSSKLNAVLKPSPRNCLETLHIVIPLAIRHKNESLMEQLAIDNDRISAIPRSVDEFSAALAYLRKLQVGGDERDEKYFILKSLYQLVEDYHIKITDSDHMNAFLLTQKKAQLKTSMELFESSCEQYTVKFGIELESRIPVLADQLEHIAKALTLYSLFIVEANPTEMIPYLISVKEQLMELEDAIEMHFFHEMTLSLPRTTAFDKVEEVKTDLTQKMDIWCGVLKWNTAVASWENLSFPKDVDIDGITNEVERFYNQVTFWETHLSPGMDVLCTHIKAKVDEYRSTMPILTDLRCPSFEERHIAQLRSLLGFGIQQDRSLASSLTLGQLVAMRLAPFAEQINRIAIEATQERLQKELLDKTIALWENIEFDVKPYKESKDLYILSSVESVYSSLEESIVSMTALMGSKYIAPIKDTAIMWQKRLTVFQDTLDAWIECQRKWMHLENIFSAPDIQKQLPNEGIIFTGVNQFWKELMRKTNNQKGCLRASGASLIGIGGGVGTGSGGAGHFLLETFFKHNASLERIEKSLEDYLETKRGFFPRFYFISNEELLDMLAHAKEPQVVQRHLCKCFDALVKLDINEEAMHGGSSGGVGNSNTQDILAMISPEGERIAFGRHLKVRGNIEDWLNTLLTNMKSTLHKHMKTCLLEYQHASREAWIFRHPAQCVTVVSYIIWAKECEICFRSASQDPTKELTLWNQTICAQLNNLTRLVRTSLTPIQRNVIISLVTTDVHFRDVVEDLIAKKVISAEDFVWEQQLRYYWHPEQDGCNVMQATCSMKYGYEYMGVCNRLVITPLTDRCWMTITGALELKYGVAPSGPAGTGKTETSKDLAKALGILCIVFNCSDQIDYKMMGKLFNGVIQAGSWTCLDEFNRIDIEVLSVVAQQMTVLRNARLSGASDVVFEGKRVALREHHVIITMNPTYAGRTELPDNLKACFRPVAMMVPDYALIAEILLFAAGFQDAKILSRKITKLYKLCSEQLSQQPHYDFGMRAVKSALTLAGMLKRNGSETITSSSASTTPPPKQHDENVLVIRAMTSSNMPKLTDEDILLFNGIMHDLFPETIASSKLGDDELGDAYSPTTWISALEEEIDRQLNLHGLQNTRRWRTKIIELFAMLEVRIGVVQTGASGSGKSMASMILKESLIALREEKDHPDKHFQRVASFVLNPKSISMKELYGFFHPVTREWTDGLASSILRSCIMEKNEQLSKPVHDRNEKIASQFYWITFDGPIDVLWIESMNTVLDDNMTLCLANGERIKLLPKIQLLFEVSDTASASPATISRLGVVYYHSSNLGWRAFVESWIATLGIPAVTTRDSSDVNDAAQTVIRLSDKLKTRILKYFELFVEPGFSFLHPTSSTSGVGSRIPIATSDLLFVTSICHIFQSLLMNCAPAEMFAQRLPFSAFAIGPSPSMASSIAEQEQQQIRCLDLMFLFSFAWSFGGNLDLDRFKKPFQEFLYRLILTHEGFLSKDLLSISGKIMTSRGVFQVADNFQEFFIDFNNLSYSPWENLTLPQYQKPIECNEDVPLFHVVVPTIDVVKYSYLLKLLAVDARKSVFLTGATGSGKSMLVNQLFKTHSNDQLSRDTKKSQSLLSVSLHFSAQTSSSVTQVSIENKFAKKRKTLLGAPVNTDLVVIYIDDINLPNVEVHGAQPPIELLRQYLEFQGFYDREKFFWKDVSDSVLIAVGGLPGGGRHKLCPRFIRHFGAVFCLPSSDEESTKLIFQTIMSAHIASCSGFTKSAKDMLVQVVDATCSLHQIVAKSLLPTPSKCHYLFNVRDIAKLMQGIVSGTRWYSSNSVRSKKPSSLAPQAVLTAETIANLWAHESIRVFRDRLTDTTDRKWFTNQLVALANKVFGFAWPLDKLYEVERGDARRRKSSAGFIAHAKQHPILFSTLWSAQNGNNNQEGTTGNYQEICDLDIFEQQLNAAMTEYNARYGKSSPLRLVFFKDAMIHIAAISRIMIQPRGHALLLGMGGSGKRSLVRLAAFMNNFLCFEIATKKNYDVDDFRDDLKLVMTQTVLGIGPTTRRRSSCGQTQSETKPFGQGKACSTVFMVNESNLVSDIFLEDINTLLNGGEVPKLFSADEYEKMIHDIKNILENLMKQQHNPHAMARVDSNQGQTPGVSSSKEFTRKHCEEYFRSRVQQAMHIVLCLNPAGATFRARVRQFPSLINCTTSNFFDEWPTSALQYVADRFLSQEPCDDTSQRNLTQTFVTGSLRTSLAQICVKIHQSITSAQAEFFAKKKRKLYVTPQHYLDLIALFHRIYREKKIQWETKLNRLTSGVIKLEDTNAVVNVLQDELVALQPILVEKAKEAEVLLHQVSIDQAEAGQVARRVAQDEAQVKQQQQDVASCQAEAQADLDQALPALNAAVAALDSLDKKDITEVKGFVKPPQAVQVVMEAVCIMLGEKPDWDTSKRILSRSTFMTELKEYDKDNISPGILKKIRRYIENPEFKVEEVKKVSRAAMSLCMWVHAIDTYARVFKEVAPKQQRLTEMNKVLDDANARLVAKQQELFNVMEKVKLLKEKCDNTLAEKQRLTDESELTQARLQRAKKLTVGLDDERIRWKCNIEQLDQDGKALLGDSFLAAASISYLGPFDGLFRTRIVREWVSFASMLIDITQPFNLLHVYGDTMELREWQLAGLPSDEVSADNAIFVMKGKHRWPLLIDPQQQGSQWIRQLEAPNKLVITKSNDKALIQAVETCLREGRPLLLEDTAETLDPSLEPVLLKAYASTTSSSPSSSSKRELKFGDHYVEADANRFRLYMTTKLANPNFVPDVYIVMNVINFTVTRDGLEEQLLSNVVRKERQEVEQRRHSLLSSISQDQKLLMKLEIKILSLLSDSSGNILDDIELINALDVSKQTSTAVTQRLKESNRTKQEVLDIRDQYRCVAARGAVLFFAIADLVSADPMYQYSLEYFSRLFTLSMDEAPFCTELPERLKNLLFHLIWVTYQNISRSLFEAHKLPFSLLLCVRILLVSGELSYNDLYLLHPSALQFETTDHSAETYRVPASTQTTTEKNSGSSVTDILLALNEKSPVFSDIFVSYRNEPSAWTSWISSENPYLSNLPGNCDDVVPRFLRLVLVRWLREEMFIDAVKCFIEETLGPKFVRSNNIVMSDIYRDMDKFTPCLFVLSPGADPISAVTRFAQERDYYEGKFHLISLGQGQGPIAEGLLKTSMREGLWLVLHNVHLAKSWLPQLEQLLAAMKDEWKNEIHDDFRLFMASFPATYFPITILQNSVKVISEPPKGIKANLMRSMDLIKQHQDDHQTTVDADGFDTLWLQNTERKLAFGLSFFHAVLQERSKFGSLGWNLNYDFSDADFLSVLALQRRLLYGAAMMSSSHNKAHGAASDDSNGREEDDSGSDLDSPSSPYGIVRRRRGIPWDALHFLTGEIYYGGRVTDEFDRRCLMANLRRFCSADSIETRQTLHRSQGLLGAPQLTINPDSLFCSADGNFYAPDFLDQESMINFTHSLPAMDSPHVFGMHPNAHILFQQHECQRLIGFVMLLQPHTHGDDSKDEDAEYNTSDQQDIKSGDAGKDANRQMEQDVLHIVQEIQGRLPSPTQLVPGRIHCSDSSITDKSTPVDPFIVVLRQEIMKCESLVCYVHTNLEELQQAIHGLVAMSFTLEQLLHSLWTQQVPLEWKKNDGSAGSINNPSTPGLNLNQSLTEWIDQLCFRYTFLQTWAAEGGAPNKTFPLSIFSFPQGFFTAILQRHARKYVIPIHHLEFRFHVVSAPKNNVRRVTERINADNSEVEQIAPSGSGKELAGDRSTELTEVDGAYISGLFIEGAQWNHHTHQLCDPQPGVMQHVMPIIHVLPQAITSETMQQQQPAPSIVKRNPSIRGKNNTQNNKPILGNAPAYLSKKIGGQDAPRGSVSSPRASSGSVMSLSRASLLSTDPNHGSLRRIPQEQYTYACPLYKTPARKGTLSTTGISTNFVLTIDLPCERPPEHYALNGTALICNRAN